MSVSGWVILNVLFVIELFKILTGKYDPEVSDFIQLKGESSTRGHTCNYKIFKIRPRLNIRKYSFIHPYYLSLITHRSSYDSMILLDPLLSSQSLNRDLNRGRVRLGSSEYTLCNYSTVADLSTVCLIWIRRGSSRILESYKDL
jgi:hypothetical protein